MLHIPPQPWDQWARGCGRGERRRAMEGAAPGWEMINADAASRFGLAPSERNAKPGSILCGDGKQDATSTRLPPRALAPAAVTIHHTSSNDGATARSEGAAPDWRRINDDAALHAGLGSTRKPKLGVILRAGSQRTVRAAQPRSPLPLRQPGARPLMSWPPAPQRMLMGLAFISKTRRV